MTNLSSTKDGAIPSRSLALLQALCFLSLAQWDNLFPSPALTSTTPSLTGTSHLLPSFPDPKTQHHIRAPPCRLGACPAAAHYDTCPKHWHWAALFEMVSEGLKKKKNSWMWVKSMKKRCEKKLACFSLISVLLDIFVSSYFLLLWLLSRKCLCHAVCAASWAAVPVRWWDPLGKCFPVCKREQTETCDKAYWNGNKLQKITQVMKLTGPQT